MNGRIKSFYTSLNSKRQTLLDRARFCSSLTKPWVLPPDGMSDGDTLPEPFSSLAARGITNLEGRLLLALYPPGRPFFALRMASQLEYDETVDPAAKQQIEQALFLQEMTMQATLESAYTGSRGGNRRRSGFRSRKRQALTQLLVTGDVLEQLTDDYRIKVFRRDQYCTKRDSSGDVLCHAIVEQIDPMTLTDAELEACDMRREDIAGKYPSDRLEDIHTLCEWNPVTQRWVIEQEIHGHVIRMSEDAVSPYMATAYELAPGESYGRGLVELNLGDIRSMNELTMSILDFSATASKQLFCVDYNSQVRPQDLAQPTGSVIQARVQSGQVTDVSLLRADKLADFQVTANTRDSIRKDLATVMLMESEATPQGERVTAFQVQRVASELEGALGGVFAPIADSQQVPLVERLMFQMKRDRILPAIPDDTVEIETLTGIAALSREADSGRMMQVLQMMTQLGPEVMQRVDTTVLVDLLMRQAGVYEPGLLKSPEQLQQEQQAAMQQQMAQQAAGKAVDVIGNTEQARAQQELTNE
jgi:hypothetical protein